MTDPKTSKDERTDGVLRIRSVGFYLAILCVGLMTGLAASGLHAALDLMGDLRAWLAVAGNTGVVPGWAAGAALGAVCVGLSAWLVRRFAPDAAGSGIPEVIVALRGAHPLDWRRLLPVKFLGGVLGIGGGLVLGREGPTIHLGAAVAAFTSDVFGLKDGHRNAAITAGAGAGLAAAFNAPLAGIVFVTEEMRREFDFGFRSFQSVILACVVATMVSAGVFGLGPILDIPDYRSPPVAQLLLFLPLGLVIGGFGVLFNAAILNRVQVFRNAPVRHAGVWALGVGAVAGGLIVAAPDLTGGGEGLIVTDLDIPPISWC